MGRNRRSAMCLKLRGVAAACERPILAAIKAAWTSRHCSRATADRRSGWASRMSPRRADVGEGHDGVLGEGRAQ